MHNSEKIAVVYIPITALKPSYYNPRRWDEKALNDLKASIKKFGLVNPAVVNGAEERRTTLTTFRNSMRNSISKMDSFKG